MKNRKQIASLIMATSMLVLSSCADNESVTYVSDSSSEQTTEKQTTETNATGESAETQIDWEEGRLDGKTYTREFSVNGKQGNKVTVDLNLEIEAEYTGDEMSVYSYNYITSFTGDMKERMIKGIFDDENIYKFDKEYRPKAYWQWYIDFYNDMINESNATQGTLDYYRERLAECQNCFEDAPEDLVPADDFSGDFYLGKIDEIYFQVETYSWDLDSTITAIEKEFKLTANDDGKFFEQVGANIYINDVVQLSEYDEEDKTDYKKVIGDGKEFTESILEKLKLEDYELGFESQWGEYGGQAKYVQGKAPLTLDYGFKYIEHCAVEKSVKTKNGYEIKLKITCPISTIGYFTNYMDANSDSYHYFLTISSFYEPKDEMKGVNLLGFNNILDVIESELTNNIDMYPTKTGVLKYNSIKLGYMTVINDDATEVSNIPCWRLCNTADLYQEYIIGAQPDVRPMFINAIDGSIIDFFDYQDGTYEHISY